MKKLSVSRLLITRRVLCRVLPLLVLASVMTANAATPQTRAPAARPLRLVAGTELIADVARDLLDGKVEILTLAPAGSCPGHHDVRAADMAFMAKADLLLLHAWQERQPAVADALRAAAPANPPAYLAGTGSWLVPENQVAASGAIARILRQQPGVDGTTVERKLQERANRVKTLAARCRQTLAPYARTPVVAAAMQEEFARWMGFSVIGTYSRAEDLTPAALVALMREGRRSKVRLVIDNQQSGAEIGKALAGELDAAHLTFSNFPGSAPGISTWGALLEYNCALAIQALR